MNIVILKGNITRDVEIKVTEKGTTIANFSIAINRKWKDSDGDVQEEVSFINCVAFGRTAEVIDEYFSQGSEILIEGRLKQETWEDKDTDKKRSALKVIVEAFHFTSGTKSDKKKKRNDDEDDRPKKKKSKIDDEDVPTKEEIRKKSKRKDDGDDRSIDEDDVPFMTWLGPAFNYMKSLLRHAYVS